MKNLILKIINEANDKPDPRLTFKSELFKNTGADENPVSVDLGHPMKIDDAHEAFGTKGDVYALADKIFGKDAEPHELKTPATADSTDAHKLFQRIKKGPDGTGFAPISERGAKSYLHRTYEMSNTEAGLRMLAHGVMHHSVLRAFTDAGILPKGARKAFTTGIRERLAATNEAGYKDGFPPMEFAAFRDITNPEESADAWKERAEVRKQREMDDPEYRQEQKQKIKQWYRNRIAADPEFNAKRTEKLRSARRENPELAEKYRKYQREWAQAKRAKLAAAKKSDGPVEESIAVISYYQFLMEALPKETNPGTNAHKYTNQQPAVSAEEIRSWIENKKLNPNDSNVVRKARNAIYMKKYRGQK